MLPHAHEHVDQPDVEPVSYTHLVSAETTGTKMCSCVEACLTGARMFGDLDDPDSDISKEIVATNAKPIAGDLTKSKVFYVR